MIRIKKYISSSGIPSPTKRLSKKKFKHTLRRLHNVRKSMIEADGPWAEDPTEPSKFTGLLDPKLWEQLLWDRTRRRTGAGTWGGKRVLTKDRPNNSREARGEGERLSHSEQFVDGISAISVWREQEQRCRRKVSASSNTAFLITLQIYFFRVNYVI